MLQSLFEDPVFGWTVALVVGIPATFLLLGELIGRLRQRGHPLASTLVGVRNWLLPALATFLLLVQVAGFDRESMAVRLLLTLVLVFLLHGILSLVKALLFARAESGSWQARTPKLVRDLLQFGLVLVGLGMILSVVWKVDLGNLLAALGVGSIVLGLALQEPLGNLFSGLMLTFERPFEVGNWIQVDGKVGRVVEVNWRAVHVLTGMKELLIIPNSALAKHNFSNFSRPTEEFGESIDLSFSTDDAPNRVKQILLETARSMPGVLTDPEPVVRTIRYEASSIVYRISFHVAHYEQLSGARDEFLTRIWYAANRSRLCIPHPTQTSITLSKAEAEAPAQASLPPEVLRPFRQFGLTDVEEISNHLTAGSVKRYACGERVMVEGSAFAGLFLILAGEAEVSVSDHAGQQQAIAQLARGDFFGEKSLLSCHTSEVTVTATADLEVLVLDSNQLHTLLEQTPRLAREIGQVMESRRKAIQHVRGARVAARVA